METSDIPVHIIKNRFVLQESLGQGGYGQVSKTTDKITNETVAIKFNKKVKNFKIECTFMENHNKFEFFGKFSVITMHRVSETDKLLMSEGQNYIVSELHGTTLR